MLLKHLARSVEVFIAVPSLIPQGLNRYSTCLDLTLLSRFRLAVIRPHLTLPSALYEARGLSATRLLMSSMLMPGSRAAPYL
jgi:hypothetical protein